MHDKLLETVPSVDRIACALYDANEDLLKTFINSTRTGEAIVGYEASLSNSHALSQLAQSGGFRVLDDIASAMVEIVLGPPQDGIVEAARSADAGLSRSLGTAQLGRRDHLLGLGDLLGRFDRVDPALEFLE